MTAWKTRILALLSTVALTQFGCETTDSEAEWNRRAAEEAEEAPASTAARSATATGGFVWKPVSESDGRLVVLLPASLRRNVERCWIASAGGAEIETGRFAGDNHNGNRPHYRFSKPGSGYGANIQVVARLKSGGTERWAIPNGASRTTY